MIGKQKAKSNLLFGKITIAQNPREIAQEFNKYFAAVGKNLAEKIPNTGKSFHDLKHLIMKKVFVELKFDEFE